MGATKQHTLSGPVRFEGVGLHSGVIAKLLLKPAPPDHGIVFKRCDALNGHADTPFVTAGSGSVVGVRLGTTIANPRGVSVATIEHLMAALSLCRVDNVLIEIDGPETPILDGSSAPFVAAIRKTGVVAQKAERRIFEVDDEVSVTEGDRSISVTPLDHLRLDVEIDFDDCVIGRQSLSVRIDDACDCERLAVSRTFCRLRDVEKMRNAGLIRGGSLENSIVVDGDRLLNGEALRDPNEFALHKALDLIGDLYLLGGPLVGHIRAVRPGHDLNVRFARELVDYFAPMQADARQSEALAASA